MQSLFHMLRIRVLPEKVFEALTTQEGIKGWWTEEVSKQEETYKFTFSGQYPTEFKLTDSEENKKVEFTSMLDDPWKDSKITFDLEKEEPNTTILKLSHKFPSDLDEDMLANCNYNWGRFLYSLKTYVETSKGFPVKKS